MPGAAPRPAVLARSAATPGATAAPGDVLRTFVRSALIGKVKGDSRAYYKLVESLEGARKGGAYVRWYTALTQSVSLICAQPPHHADLIRAVLNFSFDTTDEAVRAYSRFLVDLVCSNGSFLVPVFSVLVQQLLVHADQEPPDAAADAADDEAAAEAVAAMMLKARSSKAAAAASEAKRVTEEVAARIHAAVHSSLAEMLRVIPTSSTALFPLVVRCFPHRRQSTAVHITYVSNLLILTEYSPHLRDRILELIMQKILLIDAELQHSDFSTNSSSSSTASDHAADPASPSEQHPDHQHDDLEFLFDDDADEESASAAKALPDASASVAGSIIQQQEETPRRQQSDAADKVDRLMTLMLNFVELIRSQKPSLCDSVFESLVRVFESSVLTTHESYNVQFIIFYMCSFKNVFAETFIRRLLERAFNVSEVLPLRVSCSLYVASFLAKAKMVRHATRMHYFELLLQWLHSYADIHHTASSSSSSCSSPSSSSLGAPPPESKAHALFYCLFQALIYIFCEWRCDFEVLVHESPDLVDFFRFDALVESSLNPLRHCADALVAEFATATLQLGLADCYRVIRRNHMLPPPSKHAMPAAPSSFPFQRCRLDATAHVIRPVFETRPPQHRHDHLDDDHPPLT